MSVSANVIPFKPALMLFVFGVEILQCTSFPQHFQVQKDGSFCYTTDSLKGVPSGGTKLLAGVWARGRQTFWQGDHIISLTSCWGLEKCFTYQIQIIYINVPIREYRRHYKVYLWAGWRGLAEGHIEADTAFALGEMWRPWERDCWKTSHYSLQVSVVLLSTNIFNIWRYS